MTTETECDRTRELAAEVALGIASAADRDEVMHHAEACPSCRRVLDSFLATVDALTVAVLPTEPPPGFETAVLARLTVDGAAPPEPEVVPDPVPIGGRRRRRALVVVAAAAAAVALLAAGLALGRVTGVPGRSGQLLDASRASVGEVFAGPTTSVPPSEEPWPSWMLVAVYPGAPAGEYRVHCTYEEHGQIDDWEAGRVTVAAGKGTSFSTTMPFALDELRDIRLEPLNGQEPLSATTSPDR